MATTHGYRGRIAPSPTGYLHLGHARTFWQAFERARERRGVLIFRNEDLDPQRCRAEFVQAMFEDLRWCGIEWQEGPDVGGGFGPYAQSQRRGFYLRAWRQLLAGGWIYPCICSRKDLATAASAPHEDGPRNDSLETSSRTKAGATGPLKPREGLNGPPVEDDEPVYPGTCRERRPMGADVGANEAEPAGVNWRFRVPDGERIEFVDGRMGRQGFEAGRDFGDFLVWRRDDVPAYQLAVVVDDAAMQVSEVVRGEDLLRSTARQILLQRALGLPTPEYFHCALVTDESGVRLSKRHDALSLRRLREQGQGAEEVRAMLGGNFAADRGKK